MLRSSLSRSGGDRSIFHEARRGPNIGTSDRLLWPSGAMAGFYTNLIGTPISNAYIATDWTRNAPLDERSPITYSDYFGTIAFGAVVGAPLEFPFGISIRAEHGTK